MYHYVIALLENQTESKNKNKNIIRRSNEWNKMWQEIKIKMIKRNDETDVK